MPQVGWVPHWSHMSTRSALTRRATCLARGGIVGVAQGLTKLLSCALAARGLLELKWLPSSSIAPAVPKAKCDFA